MKTRAIIICALALITLGRWTNPLTVGASIVALAIWGPVAVSNTKPE